MSYKDLRIYRSKILPDIIIIEPSVFIDERGNIFTSFKHNIYCKILPHGVHFIHDKFAVSKYNVLRGLHGDKKTWKLVSCVWGNIYEVVVDMRENSPTFKSWDIFKLSSSKYSQILIPPGFVNG